MNPLDLECEWSFAEAAFLPDEDLVALGADLEPGTIVAAYAQGLFPMGLGEGGSEPLGWWSPVERGVLERGAFRPSRSLRRSARGMRVTTDRAFDRVVAGCADPGRDGAWITPAISVAYGRLHELGIAHSVEVWRENDLVGGLYGLAIGGLFAGESMFHRATDASKVALWGLTEIVYADDQPRLIDVQWQTDHLATLGVTHLPRDRYRGRLPELVRSPPIGGWRGEVSVSPGNRSSSKPTPTLGAG